MKKLFLFIFVMFFFTVKANAVEVSSSFNFEVNTTAGCTIQNSPTLNINYSTTQDEATASATLQFVCSANTNYTFTVGAGNNASNSRRRAENNGNYVIYRLYWDNTYNDEIMTDSNNSRTGIATGGTDSKTIYAKFLKSDNPSVIIGQYTDTVRITISW